MLPIAGGPLRRGWVLTSQGRVMACGMGDLPPVRTPTDIRDLGDVAIMPGLVNAHTHLELSWMRNRVPRGLSLPEWASRLMALRRTVGADDAAAIVDAIREVRVTGTSLVGDVTNTLAAYEPLADSELSGAVFRELLGFHVADAERLVVDTEEQLDALTPLAWLRPSIVPHAPYSVSPDLFHSIASVAGSRPISVHLGESEEEIRFLRDGGGPWRDLLNELGVWDPEWTPPGTGPVTYLERLGLLTSRLLAVHGTHLDREGLAQLATVGATVVACPRSNRWTGAGTPPIADFYASGVRVAVGTDSLASVEDLNVFAELAEMRRLAPGVPAARLIESATRQGAAALGFSGEFGTLDAGMHADMIAVRVPPGTDDVEEYLVSGIEPDAIQWLDSE